MIYTYTINTVCTATVNEEWTMTSDRPLDPEEIRELFFAGEHERPGITIEFDTQTVSDEEDREIRSTEAVAP
jgi:hypothetical protein